MTEALSYPIGRFDRTTAVSPEMRVPAIAAFADLPEKLRRAVAGLADAQLDTPYRPGGWTVRQLVHHLADSHMNGFIRLKLAITEDDPMIKPYDQDRWAELPDSRLPIDVSLGLVDAVHERWVVVWNSLGPSDYARTFRHPEIGPLTVETHLHLYAWHCRHHLAHITGLRARAGW
jgi:hypothetical protein